MSNLQERALRLLEYAGTLQQNYVAFIHLYNCIDFSEKIGNLFWLQVTQCTNAH